MIRTFLALFLTFLCACLPRTTQSPTPGDESPTPEQQTQARTPDEAQAPHSWGQWASPPPGAPPPPEPSRPVADNYAPSYGGPQLDKGERREAPRALPQTSAPADVRAESEASPAKSSASRDGAGGLGGAVAERAKKYDDRPGLGTSWGESRVSQVDEVPFVRDSGSPNYTASMHYNDASGAYALTGGSYGSGARVSLGSALTMSVRDENGNELSAYRGNGRTVAVGQNGQRYTIVVHNNTNERFEVVLSVDGLDVLDGREAAYGKRGYLIDPYGTLEVEGFRQSADAVAAFRFGSVSESYASRTGSARNVGVIGAVAFGERGYAARLAAYRDRMNGWHAYNNDANYRRNADPFPGRYATPPSYNIAR